MWDPASLSAEVNATKRTTLTRRKGTGRRIRCPSCSPLVPQRGRPSGGRAVKCWLCDWDVRRAVLAVSAVDEPGAARGSSPSSDGPIARRYGPLSGRRSLRISTSADRFLPTGDNWRADHRRPNRSQSAPAQRAGHRCGGNRTRLFPRLAATSRQRLGGIVKCLTLCRGGDRQVGHSCRSHRY
jgi:hypothetical protein